MWNDRLKEEYLAMEVPELREKILAGLCTEKTGHPRRKLRPAAVLVIAAMVAVLGLTAGAAADGLLNIKSGSKYLLRDENGVVFSPTGFYLEEDVNVLLSEKALENIEPYITHFTSGADRDMKYYETTELADMEALLDMPLILPQKIIDDAVIYRFNATEAEGEIRSMHITVLTEDEQHDGDMLVHMVYLVGFPGVVGTSSEPDFEQSVLSDGTPVSIVISESRRGGLVANMLYKIDGAVYHLEVYGDKKKALLNEVETILDTVR